MTTHPSEIEWNGSKHTKRIDFRKIDVCRKCCVQKNRMKTKICRPPPKKKEVEEIESKKWHRFVNVHTIFSIEFEFETKKQSSKSAPPHNFTPNYEAKKETKNRLVRFNRYLGLIHGRESFLFSEAQFATHSFDCVDTLLIKHYSMLMLLLVGNVWQFFEWAFRKRFHIRLIAAVCWKRIFDNFWMHISFDQLSRD